MKKDGRVNNGGKRLGAGRPPQYDEPTILINFRVPESKEAYMRKFVNEKLKEFQKKKD